MLRSIGTAIALLAADPATAQTADRAAALAQASERGALLYAYDRAAWQGTDDMLTKLRDPQASVGGYIVDGPADAPVLAFYDRAGTNLLYVARFREGRLIDGRVLAESDDRKPSAQQARMIAALVRARGAIEGMKDVPRCGRAPFNTVVLPPNSPDGPISVYFLTPQTTAEAIPLGGHFEIDVDAAGNPGALRRFSRSCIALPTKPRLKKGETPAAAFVTYLLGDVPTEIHVFSSLALGVPLMVGIPGSDMSLWQVAGASISGPVVMKK